MFGAPPPTALVSNWFVEDAGDGLVEDAGDGLVEDAGDGLVDDAHPQYNVDELPAAAVASHGPTCYGSAGRIAQLRHGSHATVADAVELRKSHDGSTTADVWRLSAVTAIGASPDLLSERLSHEMAQFQSLSRLPCRDL